ncbi:MAG: hypothetical protein E7401_03140 [Ruminococcaceae bacterium]|nr:hypothetical protein [Oscillospiraceae bacterium]
MNKIIVLLVLVFLSGCIVATINNSIPAPSPAQIVQSEIIQQETAEPNLTPSTASVKLLVKSMNFDPAKNIYAISGEIAKIVGEYPSGAPLLELGETIIVELCPDEIVKCDSYDTTTIKKLYEDYYLSKDNQFLHYPMIFDVNNKSFINYGN